MLGVLGGGVDEMAKSLVGLKVDAGRAELASIVES